MSLREAAKKALDALEVTEAMLSSMNVTHLSIYGEVDAAITALRAALAEDAMKRLTDEQQMIERGTKAWADVPDATAWVQEMRGNVPAPTSQESRQVEPVAYIKGYSKGRCIIEAVDPDWLLPVGMALYRSPPTISKTETVEPVAWMGRLEGGIEYNPYHKAALKLPDGVRFDLYTAPPKRKPLTDEAIHDCFQQKHKDKATERRMIARAIERAHGIGGEE
jgi:hypothetical protein